MTHFAPQSPSERISWPPAPGETVWTAYLELDKEDPWFNNQTYVNCLDKKAIDRFVEITHERYKEVVGDEFGRTVPSIFTDEPHFPHKSTLGFAKEKRAVTLPWTDDLPETYRAAYGSDLLDSLPEGVTHLFSGHNHAPWLIRHGGRTACNPGSLGLLEDGRGGTAPFAVMEEHAGSITLTRHLAPYDTDETARAFLRTGCAQAAPEMSRIVLHTMRTGEYQAVLKLVRFVSSLGNMGDAAVWQEADRLWPWREGVSSAEFWHRMEASL